MEKSQVTTEAILWTHSKTKLGLHPVRIKLTYHRKTKYYPIQVEGKNVYLTPSDWEAVENKDVRKALKRIKEAIEDSKSKARDSIQAITSNKRGFSFDRFEREYVLDISSQGFIRFFEDYLTELEKEGRAGSYHTYHCALQAFRAFRNNRDISPTDITSDLLKEFEGYLKKEKLFTTSTGKKIVRQAGKTTIGIYMRTLRTIYNYASNKLPHLKENYPFATHSNDRTKYRIKSGSGSKGDALTIDQLQQFFAIEVTPTSPAWVAKNLWLFSFYCNGMNFSDIARLKYEDVKSDSIVFVRKKTQETETIEETIQVPLTDPIREIIIELGNSDKRPSSYVFDFLSKGLTPIEERKAVSQRIKVTNRRLKQLCEANDLPPITTYWARHTYAFCLLETGSPIELISKLLGHSDIRVTQAYVKKNFGLETKRAANETVQSIMRKSA